MATKRVQELISQSLAIEADEATEAGSLGFLCRLLVQASLPNRRVEGPIYQRQNGNFRLTLMADPDIGLPFGTIPRLLLVWLATEAVRTRSRDLELGDSLCGFMRELGLAPTGGRWGSIPRLKDQTRRLFAASIRGVYEDATRTTILAPTIIDSADLWWDAHPHQAGLWPSTVRLSESFYAELLGHPVPLDLRAVRALKQSPIALDLYAWLSYRSSYAKRSTLIPWKALQAQFGGDYAETPQGLQTFRRNLTEALRKVTAVYPNARVELSKAGLTMHPSTPHVRRITKP